MELKIVGRTDGGQSVEITENSRVPPGDTQLVRFRIGELGRGTYQFVARGVTPIEFEVSKKYERCEPFASLHVF